MRKCWLFLILLLATACRDVKIERVSRDAVEFANPRPVVKIKRFDRDLFTLNQAQLQAELDRLRGLYPEFLDFYLGPNFMGLTHPRASTDQNLAEISAFLKHKPTRELYDTVQVVFGRVDDIEDKLGGLFQAWQHYLPNATVPEVVGIISEFNTAAFTFGDSLLAFSFECFLSAGDPHYLYVENLRPTYINRTLDRTHLPVYLAEAMINNRFGDAPDNRLIGQMINNGKKQYLLHRLLPELPDSVKLRYTAAQTQWCAANETEMWSFLTEQNLLYSTDSEKFRKYISDSPHSPGMPAQAPGRTANFIGWQIVEQYMAKHPQTTIEQLFAIRDPQQLLRASGYKPRRR